MLSFASIPAPVVGLAAEQLLASGRECAMHRAAARLILKSLCQERLAWAWRWALKRANVLNDYMPAGFALPLDACDELSDRHHKASPVYHFH